LVFAMRPYASAYSQDFSGEEEITAFSIV